jgi:DNA polymerase III subunit delta'
MMARARSSAAEEMEDLPEADRLEGFPHPRETRQLYGHDAAEAVLAQAFAGGRMHHGWLLTGRLGIGKATLAYRFARHLLAEPGERDLAGRSLDVSPDAAASRQVAALSHPGLLVLRRQYDLRTKRISAFIPVDEVRRLRSFLGHTGGDGAWRVVIVDSADELNLNAANALLKSLEEPPPRALFVLVSAEPSGLLATIRSRCRRLDLAPLSSEHLKAAAGAALYVAETEMPAPETWQRIERLADGSVRRALQLAASGGLDVYERVEAIFAALPRVDWAAAHALSDQMGFGAPEQRFAAFFDFFLELLARLVRVAATGRGDAQELALAQRLIKDGQLPVWAALWQAVLKERNEALELNLDRKALILNVLSRLEAVARG